MEKKLTEQFASNEAIDILASAIIALPGGFDALESAADAKLVVHAEDDGE